jgi:AcrR family transcriptional regulator
MTAKRRDILATAAELFCRHGYQAVGVDRVIEESGVAKMTMYRHFRSKNVLVAEVLTQRANDILVSLADAVSTRTSAIDKVHEVFSWHQTWINSDDFSGCMFAAALAEFRQGDGQVPQTCIVQKKGLRSFLAALLEEILPQETAHTLSHQLVMLIDGAILAALAGSRTDAIPYAWAAAESLITATRLCEK